MQIRLNHLLITFKYSNNTQQPTLIVAHISTVVYATPNCYVILFSSFPIGAFQWLITSSFTLSFNLNQLFLQQLRFTSLAVYPNTPCQLPCGKKPERPEKTHDFRQSRILHIESNSRACVNDGKFFRHALNQETNRMEYFLLISCVQLF